MSLVSKCLKPGLLNLPGPTTKSKATLDALLQKDAEDHHCYFRSAGLHNHLSHHLLAAYDLGAPHGLLETIYEDEAKIQRPIFPEESGKEITVDESNWMQFLGNPNAYASFFTFFRFQISTHGALKTVEKYIFDPLVNVKGQAMLIRLMGGFVHPFIQLGYGIEFGNDLLIASSLAQASVHNLMPSELFPLDFSKPNEPKGPSCSLLQIFRQTYDSTILTPVMPYDPNALLSARMKSVFDDPSRVGEINRLASQIQFSDSDKTVEEIIWVSTLLMFGTGKAGRKPRLDFFLMHLVTSALFLESYFTFLRSSVHKTLLLRAYVPIMLLTVLIRGRPIIKPELIMGYTDVPRPPTSSSSPSYPLVYDDDKYNPWTNLVNSVMYAPDSHTVKTMRTLVYATRRYGTTRAGEVPGTYLSSESQMESHEGMGKVDGTLFVRAAGVLMDYMGWVTHGQEAREDWDRSALGWAGAWEAEDE